MTSASTASTHLPSTKLAGRSIPEALRSVEHHLSVCAECREEYTALRQASPGLMKSPMAEPLATRQGARRMGRVLQRGPLCLVHKRK